MARNRQRAKERQARRKTGGQADARPQETPAKPTPSPTEPPEAADGAGRVRDEEEIREDVDLQVGAPPENLGRSDEVLEDEPDLKDDEHFDPAADRPEEDGPHTTGPTGRRGDAEVSDHKNRPRFIQFLFAVRAELARVQWPDRQALTTLTGVVLGFVLLAGGYLGLLDAIFSRIIQAIL